MSTEQAPLGFPLLSYVEVQTGRTVSAPLAVKMAQAADVVALCRPTKTVNVPQGFAGKVYSVGFTRTSESIPLLVLRWWYRAPDVADTRAAMKLIIKGVGFGVEVGPVHAVIPDAFSGTLRGFTATFGASGNPAGLVLGGEGYINLDDVAAEFAMLGYAGDDWTFEFSPQESGSSTVTFQVEGFEAPHGLVSDAAAAGALVGPLNPGNPIRAGSITTDGWERIQATLQAAALVRPEYLLLTWPDDDAEPIPQTTATSYAALTNLEEAPGDPILWRVRIRPMTVAAPPGTNAGEVGRWRVRYKVTGGGDAKVRIYTGSATSPHVSATLSSATWAWSDWAPCRLPTDGTGQVARLSFKGQVDSGSTLYISGIVVEGDPS